MDIESLISVHVSYCTDHAGTAISFSVDGAAALCIVTQHALFKFTAAATVASSVRVCQVSNC